MFFDKFMEFIKNDNVRIMNRGTISGLFRKLGLSHLVDYIRFHVKRLENSSKNKAFQQQNPDVAIPPDYLIYESFQMNYEKYYLGGRKTAKWLTEHFRKYKKLNNIAILDWGCGPGRTIRHLPELMDASCSFSGTDVNTTSIDWCKKHLKGITFAENQLQPPLTYGASQFDIAYAISILTHLSEENQHKWLVELQRVLKPSGIFLVTTHGVVFKTILSEEERKLYEEEQIVIRGNVREGHRVYGAFHPPAKMRTIFENYFNVLAHVPGTIQNGKPEQDVWVLQKRDSRKG